MKYGHKGGLRSPYERSANGFEPSYIFTPRLVGRLACGELAVEPVLGQVRVAEIKPYGDTSVFVGWRDEHGPGTAAGTYRADRSFDVRMPAYPDRLLIRQGIDQARWHRRNITGSIARLIAVHLHAGQNSALHDFMVDGRVEDRLYDELDTVGRQRQYAHEWVDELARYCLVRDDPGPLPGWNRRALSAGEARAETWLRAAGVNVGELERTVTGNGRETAYPDLIAREQMSTETAMQLIEAAFTLGMEVGSTSRVARTRLASQQPAAPVAA
jgi:hypothetical protein